MKRQRSELSLRIEHPNCDLAAVCDALGLRPARTWKKGDERRTPKGTKTGGTYDKSTCMIVFGQPSRKSLPVRLEAALELIKPHRSVLRKVSSTGGSISFYIAWFCDEHTGERLTWSILEAMTDLRIALDLNIYVPDRPNGDEA
jgi:hypothetical protein